MGPEASRGSSFIDGYKSTSSTLRGSIVSQQCGLGATSTELFLNDAMKSRQTMCHHSLWRISCSKTEYFAFAVSWCRPREYAIRISIPTIVHCSQGLLRG